MARHPDHIDSGGFPVIPAYRNILIPVVLGLAAAFAFLSGLGAPVWAQPAAAEKSNSFSYELKYSVSYKGMPPGIERMFDKVSDLEQLKGQPPVSLGELDRRVRRDIDTLETVLRAEAYYQAEIDYQMDRTQTPIRILIEVTPGTRFKVKSAELAFEGDPPLSAALQEAAQIPAKMVGDPARSQHIIEVEEDIMRRLPELGYPLAKLGKRLVIVDHADLGVAITYRVTPGSPAVFGPLTVTGLKSVRMSYVRELVPWREGARYDQALVDSYRARLAATGLFSLIRVAPAQQTGKGGLLPMAVIVREAKHHTYGGGVNYSSGQGFGTQIFWENRNLFGNQEKLRTTAQYSEILKSLGADFVKPNFRRFDQKLLANVTLVRDTPVAYRESAVKSLVAVERQINKRWAASVGTSFDYSHITDVNGTRKYRLVGVPLMLRYDGSNSLLNPTKGMRFQILVQPYTGTESGLIHFVRNEALGSVYFPLDQRHNFVFAARTRIGGIFGESRDRLPADKRFYAGGGNSIRGYRYQFVGPVVAQLQSDGSINQVPVGGRSVFEVGAEMRVKVTQKIGLVPFIEGGNVFDRSYPDFSKKLRWGAGLGLRYYTDFAPIRFDFAVPLNRRDVDSRYQIYISIGQAF